MRAVPTGRIEMRMGGVREEIMMKNLKERLKRRYGGLKEYFLDWYHGTDKMSRWLDRYGKELEVLRTPKMELIVHDVDHVTGWDYKNVRGRRTGVTTALSLGAYFEAKVRGKQVLVLVGTESEKANFERHLNLFNKKLDGVLKRYKAEGAIRIETVSRMKEQRGIRFDTAMIDRHRGNSQWFEVMDFLRDISAGRPDARVIEWNLISE